MGKEKKFITCDGNTAAAHVAYMFSEVAASTWMSGQLQVARISSATQFSYRKCSQRQVQQVLYTVLSRQVRSQPPSLLLRVCS